MRKIDQSAKSTWSSSQLASTNDFKPGGTGIVTFGKTATRIIQSGRDELGRWSWIILKAKGLHEILIITVYQCCKLPTNKHGNTAYHQQQILLSTQNRTDRNIRSNFYKDLRKFLTIQTNRPNVECSPIIMGDWNEECKNTSNSRKICDEFGLVDLWHYKHPTTEFRTYARGSRRIDFVITTPAIAAHTTSMIYEPFQYRLSGDHRGFYIDIPEHLLLGNNCPPVYDPSPRGIKTKDKKAVTRYLRACHKHLRANNVFKRLHDLSNNNRPDHSLAEILDNELIRAGAHADKQCRKRRTDFWNIELHTLKRELSVWCLYRSRTNRNLPTHSLRRRAAQVGILIKPTVSIDDVNTRIINLRQQVHQIHLNSKEKRRESQRDQANLAEDAGEHKLAKTLRHQALIERKHAAFRQVKNASGQATTDGITRVQVPADWPTSMDYDPNSDLTLTDPKLLKDASDWREVLCPKEIEFSLLLRNQRHFGQAETDKTPFTQPPLTHQLNWSASSASAELVLEGDYDTTALDNISALLIDNLTRVTDLDSLPKEVSMIDMREKFTKWKETTSTSPSGRHLGHYKVLFTSLDSTLSFKDKELLESYQHDIADAYRTIINYAIRHRYSFKRWKNIINMMIYKDPGNVKVHRLRVIHLYEADLNFILGLKWKDALHKAQQENTLHPGQYGSRPGREPQTVTLLEELRLDYSLLTRTPFTNFDNDASSCYDRILLSISSLCARGHGIHRDVVFVHATTLKDATFKLKLSQTVSDEQYQHCVKFPIHGSGQGSANSPTIWCFISCKLFHCHHAKAHGMLFASPDGDISLRISIIGFVDDSTCTTGGDPTQSIDDLLQKMQHDAQLWNDLLWASGGKLELPKCGFHIIYYNFDDSGIPIMQHCSGKNIHLHTAEGSAISITEKNIFTPRKNLGHYKSPAGTTHTQTHQILARATELSNTISACCVSRAEAKTLYQAVYRPAIEYTIPQSFMSEKQLKLIERKTLPKIFAKCGFNRNTARPILFGPQEIGGGGFVPLYAVAGSGYIKHFLKHWRTPKEQAGKILRIVLLWSQYQSGVSFPILSRPTIDLSYIQGRFITQIRQYLTVIHGRIDLDVTFTPKALRQYDRALMQSAIESQAFTNQQLERINCVRMYLGITYLSEISTIEGTKIAPSITNRESTNPTYMLTLGKVYQKRPNQRSWALWEKLISLFTHPNHHTLITPLKGWLPTHSCRGLWKSYISTTNIIYDRQTNSTWNTYYRRGCTLIPQHQEVQFQPTDTHQPIEIITFRNGTKYCNIPSPLTLRPSHRRSTDWDSLLHNQPQWVQQLLQSIWFDDVYSIVHAITHEASLLVVSDGSAKQHGMTYGWILSTPTGVRLASGNGPCNGRPSSLRSEAAGMLAASLFLAMVQEFTNFHFDPILVQFMADNMELINRQSLHLMYTHPYPNMTLKAEYDLTEQIYNTHQKYRIKATFTHVKGHQDDDAIYDDLSLEAQLNVDADELAEKYYSSGPQSTPQVHLLPSSSVTLFIRNISITNDYQNQLIRSYTEPAYIGHLQDKFGWSTSTTTAIAWKSLSCGIRRMGRHCLVTKICNDLLPTASTLHRWKYQNHDTCCLCGQTETREHLYLCSHPSRIKWKIRYMTALRACLIHLQTKPGLIDTLCSSITDWLDNGWVDSSKYPVKYHKAIHTQSHIGWRQVFMGRLSQEWEKLQGNTHLRTGRDRTAFLWGASVIEVTLQYSIELWEQRNSDVHGHTAKDQHRKLLERHQHTISKLLEYKPYILPVDAFLFDGIDDTLSHCNAQTLGNWIATRQHAIKASALKAQQLSATNTPSILQWLSPGGATTATRLRWRRDQLLFDPYSKKKKRRKNITTGKQTSITHFLSLHNHI